MAGGMIKGLTVKIGGDTTELGKALKDVEFKSRNLSSELRDIEKLLKMDPGNMDLLAQKQQVLQEAIEASSKKLETLREAEQQVQKQFERGEASREQVIALKREIDRTEAALTGYQKAAQKTADDMERLGKGAGEAEDEIEDTGKEAKDTAKKVDDLGDSAKDAEKDSKNLGSTLAGAAKAGMAAVGAAAAAAVAGLVAAAESTREYRTEMGKLDAAFTSSGHSSETAAAAYSTLYGVIGETDQAVEAAQQIALLAKSEKDVAAWADLASGVVGKFGDALQPETFFEAANETMKLGEATGAYVQMLEGCGMSVEEFNEGLKKCKTEEQRQAYMLSVTEKALGAAGEAYEKNNAEIIRANKANDEWMKSLSGVGGAIEPIITDVKLMGASLLADAVPGVQALAEAFRGLLNGDVGASADFGAAVSDLVTGLVTKITDVLPTIASTGVSIISTLIGSLQTQIPTLMTTGVSIVNTLIRSLLGQLPTLLSTGAQIIIQLLSGIASALPGLLQTAVGTITQLVNTFSSGLPQFLQQGTTILMNLVTGIANSLPSLVNQALDAIQQFATTLATNAPTLIQSGFEMLSKLIEGVVNCIPDLIAKVPTIISTFASIINDNFPTILSKGVQLLWQLIKGIISAIPDLIANIPKIIQAFVDVWEAFNWLNLGKKALQFLGNGIKSMWGWVKSAGKGALDAIVNVIKNLPQNLLNLGKQALQGLGNAIKSGWSTIRSAASSLLNNIVNFFKTLPGKLLTVGKDLIKGLWNGISDMAGWVVNKIKGLGSSILGAVKSIFGIASPSKEFAKIGRYLDEGLAKGLEDNMRTPVDAAKSVAEDAMNAAQEMDGMSLERSLQNGNSRMAMDYTATFDNTVLSRLDKIISAIEAGQVLTLDGKALIGGTATEYDRTLGQRRILIARGAV